MCEVSPSTLTFPEKTSGASLTRLQAQTLVLNGLFALPEELFDKVNEQLDAALHEGTGVQLFNRTIDPQELASTSLSPMQKEVVIALYAEWDLDLGTLLDVVKLSVHA